jgi:serine/threonine protein kinase
MVKHIATGVSYAAKIVPLNKKNKKRSGNGDGNGDGDTAAMEEAVLQMRLRHKHIVRILDVFHEPDVRGCFIEELMRGGTVHEWRCEGALKVGMALFTLFCRQNTNYFYHQNTNYFYHQNTKTPGSVVRVTNPTPGSDNPT